MNDIEDDLTQLHPPYHPLAGGDNDTLNISAGHYRTLEQIASVSQRLIEQNNHLQAELMAMKDQLNNRQNSLPTPTHTPSPDGHRRHVIKAKEPTPFSGEKRQELETFLSQCRLYFLVSAESFTHDQRKVMFAGSYLEGIAYSWFEPLLRAYEKYQEKPAENACPPQLVSFATFSSALIAMFGDPDLRRSKLRELQNLRQDTSVAAYSSEFQRLQPYIDWNEAAFYDRFYDGLRSNVKDGLALLEQRPQGLQALIQKTREIDIRIAERITERKSDNTATPHRAKPPPAMPQSRLPPNVLPPASRQSQAPPPSPGPAQLPAFTPDGTTPMILDAHRRSSRTSGPRRLTPQEREYRMANNLCIFCGAGDHYKSSCPERLLSEQRRARYAQSIAVMTTHTPSYALSQPSVADEAELASLSEKLSTQE
jgi:hypothetical protein